MMRANSRCEGSVASVIHVCAIPMGEQKPAHTRQRISPSSVVMKPERKKNVASAAITQMNVARTPKRSPALPMRRAPGIAAKYCADKMKPTHTWPRSSNFELFQIPIPVIWFKFSNSRSLPNFQIHWEFENLKKNGCGFKFSNYRTISNNFLPKLIKKIANFEILQNFLTKISTIFYEVLRPGPDLFEFSG